MGILGEAENKMSNHQFLKIRQQSINEGFAYLGQDCWLRRASIRENIICGNVFHEEFYKKVLKVTALDQEILVTFSFIFFIFSLFYSICPKRMLLI